MIEQCFSLRAAMLQPEPSPLMTDQIWFLFKTGMVVVAIVIILFFVLRALRRKTDSAISKDLQDEFEKSKEILLLAAQAKKAEREAETSGQRQAGIEEKERELLKENVDPQRVIGQICPLCGLEMTADQELVIDPYTGQGYHFSSFLNDWPPEAKRPRLVYCYPQNTVVNSGDLLRSF